MLNRHYETQCHLVSSSLVSSEKNIKISKSAQLRHNSLSRCSKYKFAILIGKFSFMLSKQYNNLHSDFGLKYMCKVNLVSYPKFDNSELQN